MSDKIFFSGIKVEELKSLFKSLITETINEQLTLILKNKKDDSQQELITRKEVADYFGVSFVTLRAWEKANIIPKPIRKGSRVYWRKSDIMNNINKKEKNNG